MSSWPPRHSIGIPGGGRTAFDIQIGIDPRCLNGYYAAKREAEKKQAEQAEQPSEPEAHPVDAP